MQPNTTLTEFTFLSERPQLFQLTERLGTPTIVTTSIAIARSDVEGPFKDVADFIDRAIDYVDVSVREYSIKDSTTKVVVPEEYAAKLDQVRRLRLASEGIVPTGQAGTIIPTLLQRLLPEELIPLIAAMPQPAAVRRVLLLDQDNSDDVWHRQTLNNPTFASAATTSSSEIAFYRRNWDRYLFDEFAHEWAHCVRDQNPQGCRMYAIASDLELTGFYARDRARISAEENWAVHYGEDLLSPARSLFENFANEAPLRATVLATALRLSLEHADTTELSALEAEWQSRLEHLDTQVRPRAIQILIETVAATPDQQAGQNAARLLVYLGEGPQLKTIPHLKHLNLSGEIVGDPLLETLIENTHIQDLNLSSTYLTSEGSYFLRSMTSLKTLNLAGTKIRDATVSTVSRMPWLLHVDLSLTQLTDLSASFIRTMPHLLSVHLAGTAIGIDAIEKLRKSRPNLKVIY